MKKILYSRTVHQQKRIYLRVTLCLSRKRPICLLVPLRLSTYCVRKQTIRVKVIQWVRPQQIPQILYTVFCERERSSNSQYLSERVSNFALIRLSHNTTMTLSFLKIIVVCLAVAALVVVRTVVQSGGGSSMNTSAAGLKGLAARKLQVNPRFANAGNIFAGDTGLVNNIKLQKALTSNIGYDTSLTNNIKTQTVLTSNIGYDTSLTNNIKVQKALTSNIGYDTSLTKNTKLQTALTSNSVKPNSARSFGQGFIFNP
jgi:hypothetical protein